MASLQKHDSTTKESFGQFFRLIFVLFFLYLTGDAFYRWDGFRYYASFYDFIPSVALVSILWSFTAIGFSIILFPILRVFEWFFIRIKWKLSLDHILVFIGIMLLTGMLFWKGEIFIRESFPITIKLKPYFFLFTIIASAGLTWLFHDKAEKWIEALHERITPLVWLFGIWVILSMPMVAYHTLFKETANIELQKTPLFSSAANNRPNIILVTFDALTARDMSAYNYPRPTTPFIAKWAKDAHMFSLAEAENNYTVTTTASLMTGKRIWTHRHYSQYDKNPVKGNIESLPLTLKNNGYFNMAYVSNSFADVKMLKVSNGFDIAPPVSDFREPDFVFGAIDKFLYQHFYNKIKMHEWFVKEDFILYKIISGFIVSPLVPDKIKSAFKPAPSENKYVFQKALARFLEVIDNKPPTPFFVWIHLWPPHFPYVAPEPYLGMFNSSPDLRSPITQRTQNMQLKKWNNEIHQHFPEEKQPLVDFYRDRYDEYIRYCDKQFEDFIAELESRNILENSVVILSSDHGESFEHAYFKHYGMHLYEDVTHIPLIIKEPNQNKGTIIKEMVEQIDIPATILDLAEIQVPLWMEGRSLLPLMRGEKLPSRPAFSMALLSNPSRGREVIDGGTFAVWEGDYKLIHFMDMGRNLLFNLRRDPGEIQNLFEQEPEISQRLLSLIQDELKKANKKIRKGE